MQLPFIVAEMSNTCMSIHQAESCYDGSDCCTDRNPKSRPSFADPSVSHLIDTFKLKKRQGCCSAQIPQHNTLFRLTKGVQTANAC